MKIHSLSCFPTLEFITVMSARCFAIPFLLISCCPLMALADQVVIVNSREQLIHAAQNAGPGSKILIAPGNYRGALTLENLQGTADKPIVIAGQDEDNPPVFEGGGSGIHFVRPGHLELHHLVIKGAQGNGLNLDDGGERTNPAEHIHLHHLTIQEIGPKGNRDGIKLSGVKNFRIEHCTIERWGDAGSAIDMVGCHQGIIEHCQFRFRDDVFANGVQTKGGTSEVTVRRCRFEHAGSRSVNIGGSTGRPYFRPPDPGYEAKEITVEDCFFIGSMAPIAYVGVDGATVRYNTIYRPKNWVIRILQESSGDDFAPCRNGTFTNNLIVFHSDEVRRIVNIGSGTLPETFTFSKNHWYCEDAPQRSRPENLPVEETGSTYGQNPQLLDAESGKLSLRENSPVEDAGVRPH